MRQSKKPMNEKAEYRPFAKAMGEGLEGGRTNDKGVAKGLEGMGDMKDESDIRTAREREASH